MEKTKRGPEDTPQIATQMIAPPPPGLTNYDPFAALAQGGALSINDTGLVDMSSEEQANWMTRQMEAHIHEKEVSHHAAMHPLLRGNTAFSAQAQAFYLLCLVV